MFAFLSPFWLITIPLAAGLLIAAYLRHGRSKKRQVSSLFFIRQVAPSVVRARQKFSLPLRLIFELLVLIALVAAISGMLLKDSSARLILVIDNSLSMGAALNPGELATETLLDEAKRSARSNLELFSDAHSASVWLTNPSARELTKGFVPADEARRAIDQIQLSFSEGGASTALSLVRDDADKILVLSDQSAGPSTPESRVKFVPLNTMAPRRENIAIEELSISSTFERDERLLSVKLHSFLQGKALCQVSADAYNGTNWQRLGSHEIAFVGNQSKSIEFGFSAASAFRATLESCNSKLVNTLKFDDKAWLSAETTSSALTFVSPFSKKELALDELSIGEVRVLSPDEWTKRSSPNTVANGEVLVFHRFSPARLPTSNALFIFPPANSPVFELKDFSQPATLTRWDRESVLTRFLTFPDLSLSQGRVFVETPPWANALIRSSEGVIALTGIRENRRYAALGFEILPFEGKRNPFTSILLLNLLKWLGGVSQYHNLSLEKILLPFPADSVKVLDSLAPDPKLTFQSKSQTLSLSVPAFLEASDQGQKASVAANFYSSAESNVLEPGVAPILSTQPSKDATISGSRIPLELYLMLIALFVLILDSALLLIRRTRAI